MAERKSSFRRTAGMAVAGAAAGALATVAWGPSEVLLKETPISKHVLHYGAGVAAGGIIGVLMRRRRDEADAGVHDALVGHVKEMRTLRLSLEETRGTVKGFNLEKQVEAMEKLRNSFEDAGLDKQAATIEKVGRELSGLQKTLAEANITEQAAAISKLHSLLAETNESLKSGDFSKRVEKMGELKGLLSETSRQLDDIDVKLGKVRPQMQMTITSAPRREEKIATMADSAEHLAELYNQGVSFEGKEVSASELKKWKEEHGHYIQTPTDVDEHKMGARLEEVGPAVAMLELEYKYWVESGLLNPEWHSAAKHRLLDLTAKGVAVAKQQIKKDPRDTQKILASINTVIKSNLLRPDQIGLKDFNNDFRPNEGLRYGVRDCDTEAMIIQQVVHELNKDPEVEKQLKKVGAALDVRLDQVAGGGGGIFNRQSSHAFLRFKNKEGEEGFYDPMGFILNEEAARGYMHGTYHLPHEIEWYRENAATGELGLAHAIASIGVGHPVPSVGMDLLHEAALAAPGFYWVVENYKAKQHVFSEAHGNITFQDKQQLPRKLAAKIATTQALHKRLGTTLQLGKLEKGEILAEAQHFVFSDTEKVADAYEEMSKRSVWTATGGRLAIILSKNHPPEKVEAALKDMIEHRDNLAGHISGDSLNLTMAKLALKLGRTGEAAEYLDKISSNDLSKPVQAEAFWAKFKHGLIIPKSALPPAK